MVALAVTRIALGIEYDGSRFHGWQAQPGVRSVQGELMRALSGIADEPLRLQCAGRTDRGVHALGQVVHFDTRARREARAWLLGGNSRLPDDIAITWVREVDETFHARFSATARTYRYVIDLRPNRPALLRNQVAWHRWPLEVERMRRAARHLVGEHDFSAYRAAGCQARHAVRRIHHLEVSRQGRFVHIDIEANAFLHHMVRNIAGVLMEIGRGERPESWTAELLELRDRTAAGITAPAAGLYLVSVTYPDRFRLPPVPRPPLFDVGDNF